MTDSKKQAQLQNSGPTIAYLLTSLETGTLDQMAGVIDAARYYHANLICVPMGGLNDSRGFQSQMNILHNLVNTDTVDGIISWASAIGNFVEPKVLEEFHKGYQPLPLVTIGAPLPGSPALVIDSYAGMYEAVAHLIQDHGYRQIAFIQGPEKHFYAQERYRAYREALEAHNIPFDSNLVTLPGSWTPETASAGVQLLLDERKLRPQVDFQALVGANDTLTISALNSLRNRNIKVPQDIALVGFDNRPEGETCNPPLTSVAAPFYELGYQAVETLLAVLQGKDVALQINVPPKMKVRRSCGCQPAQVTGAATGPAQETRKDSHMVLSAQKEQIIEVVNQVAGTLSQALPATWSLNLVENFVTELDGGTTGTFLAVLDDILFHVPPVTDSIEAINRVISVMRRHSVPYMDHQTRGFAEDLVQQARMMIAEANRRFLLLQQLQDARQAQLMDEVRASLTTTFDLEALMDIVVNALTRLQISSCYLVLYDNPALYQYPQPMPKRSELVLAYNQNKRVELDTGSLSFETQKMLPEAMWPKEDPFSFILAPLHFQNTQLGFVVFSIESLDGLFYKALGGEISSALQGSFLVRRQEKRRRQMETLTEVSVATATILNMNDLLQQVVDLTKTRFEFYHAHIYMVDELGDNLVLAAGAGEAGREMMTQGWSIPLEQKDSLVAEAARSSKLVWVDDVHQVENWFMNPLLPNTYAEMAMPIIVDDIVVGVLDVQQDKIAGLDQDDADLLYSLANYLVVAIQNARLFGQVEQALAETRAAQVRYVAQSWLEGTGKKPFVEHLHRRLGDVEVSETVLDTLARRAVQEAQSALVEEVDEVSTRAVVTPIKLQDQIIGTMQFHQADSETGKRWGDTELALIQAIADQVAQTAENLRLFDETRERADYERLVGEITQEIRQAPNLDMLAKTATEAINNVLGTSGGGIRLNIDPRNGSDKN